MWLSATDSLPKRNVHYWAVYILNMNLNKIVEIPVLLPNFDIIIVLIDVQQQVSNFHGASI